MRYENAVASHSLEFCGAKCDAMPLIRNTATALMDVEHTLYTWERGDPVEVFTLWRVSETDSGC